MATTTVREALQFSALLRQPRTTPKAEKLEYVEEIIKLLERSSELFPSDYSLFATALTWSQAAPKLRSMDPNR